MKTCCVTGHRAIPTERIPDIEMALKAEILLAIEDCHTHFISGFASGVDLMFAGLVAELKADCPLTLEAAIPYPGRMKTPDQVFQRLIGCCDVVRIHADRYSKGCYMVRNRYMVERSERVIAVYDGRSSGGTAATIKYAAQFKRVVREIHP